MKVISIASRNYIFPELQQSGLTLLKIECEKGECPDQSLPIKFPGSCCPKCGMTSTYVV